MVMNDECGILLSNNCMYGTDKLYVYISYIFTAMLCHGYALPSFLQSSMIPIPKGAGS